MIIPACIIWILHRTHRTIIRYFSNTDSHPIRFKCISIILFKFERWIRSSIHFQCVSDSATRVATNQNHTNPNAFPEKRRSYISLSYKLWPHMILMSQKLHENPNHQRESNWVLSVKIESHIHCTYCNTMCFLHYILWYDMFFYFT
jgi:hypothetical protein